VIYFISEKKAFQILKNQILPMNSQHLMYTVNNKKYKSQHNTNVI